MNFAQFHWSGVDVKGFRIQGKYQATTASEVEVWLRAQQIIPLTIIKRKKWHWLHHKKIKFTDITHFSRELLLLFTAGIPLATALSIMEASSATPSMRSLTCHIKKQIEEGHLLSAALRSQKKYFDDIFLHFIAAGEQSGQLEQVLRHIIHHRERMTSLKRTLLKALYYPTMVLLVALAVTVGLLLFVVPQFEALFSGVGATLPSMTRGVIYLAQHLRSIGFTGLIILLASTFLFYFSVRRIRSLKLYWQILLLHLPFVGLVIKEMIIARCFYTLAMMLQAGLPLLDGLQIVSKIANHLRFETAFISISKQIQAGNTLHDSLKNKKLFSNRVLQMVTIGEESGHLDAMLLSISEFYAERVNDKVNTFSQLLEPIMMVFLSVVVGTLVVAMYLPIFRLGSVL